MKIGIIVGESSGDKLAANLFKHVMYKNKNIQLIGVVGPELMKIGCKKIFSMNELSTFGLIEPFIKIKLLLDIKKKLLNFFMDKIDMFIGIDFPGFNLNLEKILKRNGIFTFHIVSPSIWAWRSYRINNIKKSINVMFLLYHFEFFFYEKKKIPFKWIGHPFVNKINTKISKNLIKLKLKINKRKQIISILPGSRYNEIKHHLNIYKKIVCEYKLKTNIIFTMSISNENHYNLIKNLYLQDNNNIKILFNQFYNVLIISDLIIVASGTACLESALHKKIIIVIYKLNNLVFKFLKIFIKIKYISLPNIIYKRHIFMEYIQNDFNVKNIRREITKKHGKILINKNIYAMEQLFHSLNKKARNNFDFFLSNFFFN